MKPQSWLQRALLCLFHHYAVCIGDARTHSFKQTRFTRGLALLLNALTQLLLPLVTWESLQVMEGVKVNLLMLASNYACKLVRLLATIYMVIMRPRLERQQHEIILALRQLDRLCFERLPRHAAIERRFIGSFYAKYALMLLMMLAVLLPFGRLKQHWHWHSYVLLFCYLHIMNMLNVAMFHYYLMLLAVCRRYSYINLQLRLILQQLLQKPPPPQQQRRQAKASGRIQLQRLLRAHWQLGNMIERLNGSYHLQMLTARFSFFARNVLAVYMGYVLSVQYDMSRGTLLVSLLVYFAFNLDFYMLDMMCDITVKERNATADYLRGFSQLQAGVDEALQKDAEQFALQISSTKLRIDSAGLFVVDKRLWFIMSACIIDYTIVLVQFHIALNNEGNHSIITN